MIFKCFNKINRIHNSNSLVKKKKIDLLELELSELKNIVSNCDTKQYVTCCICMMRPNNYANIACGHMCVCLECSERLDEKCPMCRKQGLFIKVINSGFVGE